MAREQVPPQGNHFVAVLQALFVTLLWSSSWVLIKQGLGEIPPLTFAGLRYTLAAMVLWAALLASPARRAAVAALGARAWLALVLLGLVMYSLTQGAQFVALAYLPAQSVSLALSLTPVLVALLGTFLLAEGLRPAQWVGVGLVLVGALVYFLPGAGAPGTGATGAAAGAAVGWAVAGLGALANAASALLGRAVNRGGRLGPLVVTAVSMGAGALVLLGAGALVQGLPALSARGWLIVVWLALVNTAFAFTLWNLTLRRLSATESSVINNTMLVQIAVLAYFFLGEPLGARQVVAFGLVVVGTLVVQLRRAGVR
jgi:drug/metabolite transporter (DMT)-like permease